MFSEKRLVRGRCSESLSGLWLKFYFEKDRKKGIKKLPEGSQKKQQKKTVFPMPKSKWVA